MDGLVRTRQQRGVVRAAEVFFTTRTLPAPVDDTQTSAASEKQRKKKPSEGRKVDSWIWKSNIMKEYNGSDASIPYSNGASINIF